MSKRNFNEVLIHEDFAYRVQTKNPKNGEELLYCVHRKDAIGCKARAKRFCTGEIVVQVGHSGHQMDKEKALSKAVRYSLRQYSAQNQQLPPRELLSEMRETHGVEAVMLAGTRESLSKVIHRARKRQNIKSQEHKTDEEQQANEFLDSTAEGSSFEPSDQPSITLADILEQLRDK